MAAISSNTIGNNALITPVRQLYLHLLSFPTATSALAAWINARGLGSDTIRAKVMEQAYGNAVATRKGAIAKRRVLLTCGPYILSEATIVYRDYLLPAELRSQLRSTDLPFGEVVNSLRPSRRTTFASLIAAPNTVLSRDQLHPFTPILELHATVTTADLGPIARVREVYGAYLLSNASFARDRAHTQPRSGEVAET
jgi:hypothetical protein